MRLMLISLTALFLAGCVTTEQYPGGKGQLKELPTEIRNELGSLRDEVGKLRAENQELKGQLQQVQSQQTEVVRMPTAAEIQTALQKAGYYQGQIDNQIGSATKEAIKKFQAANGITPDGVVGSRTWAALNKYFEKK